MALENTSLSPAPSSTSLGSPLALSARINAASRTTHSQLNRLITARLPLALPPCTADPSLYITGLLHFAPIYITFESLWDALLDAPQPRTVFSPSVNTCPPEIPLSDPQSPPLPLIKNGSPPVQRPETCPRTHSVLENLLIPGLKRSGRLRADLQTLTGAPEHTLEERLSAASQNPNLAAFLAHVRLAVNTKPHVLLAYAWVLYMALFSGGRYLRASLLSANSSFWTTSHPSLSLHSPKEVSSSPLKSRHKSLSEQHDTRPPPPSVRRPSLSEGAACDSDPPLRFFNFPGAHDGEDVKADFKTRFAAAETQLTGGEKDDVVSEAQRIFSFMVGVVVELDGVCATGHEDALLVGKKMVGVGGDAVGMRGSGGKREGRRSAGFGYWVEMVAASSVAMMVGLNEMVRNVQARVWAIARSLRRLMSTSKGLKWKEEIPSGTTLVGRRLSMFDCDGGIFLSLTSMIPVLVLIMAILAWVYILL